MRKLLLPVFMFAILAALLCAATLNATPTNHGDPLPDEDVLLCRVAFLNDLTQIDIYKGRADIILNGLFYALTGTGVVDRYGAVELLESPTGNAVVILPDGSCDLYLGGIQYRFTP